jgi:hypothetical protein
VERHFMDSEKQSRDETENDDVTIEDASEKQDDK